MTLNTERIHAVRAAVGSETIELLTNIFRQSDSALPGVQADRYRADHPEWLDVLDRLESDQLFLQRPQRNAGNYQVRVYALPLLEDARAQELMQHMESIYTLFKAHYRKHLSEPMTLAEIAGALGADAGSPKEASVREALHYMCDGHSVWSGMTTGFPYMECGTISVSEAVLRHGDFAAVLNEFYDWHILNPERRANSSANFLTGISDKNADSFFGQAGSSRPEWYEKLDNAKRALISELDVALRSDLAALPTMGIRSLVESVMLDHIEDAGTFKKNLSAFSEAGFITRQHATLIEGVVDAGHAAVHRAFFPNPSDLRTIVETVGHLMHGVYILKPQIDKMSENLPQRLNRDSRNT